MRSSVKTTPLQQSTAALLAVGVPRGGSKTPASLRALDKSLKGEISRVLASGDFSGKPGETAVFYPSSGPKRVALVGIGKADAVDGGAVRKAAAHAARRAVEFGASSLAFAIAGEVSSKVEPEQFGRTVMEGAGQGGWVFEQLR